MVMATALGVLLLLIAFCIWKKAALAADPVPADAKEQIQALSRQELKDLVGKLWDIADGPISDSKRDAVAIWHFAKKELERREKPEGQVKEENRLNRNRALEAVRAAAMD